MKTRVVVCASVLLLFGIMGPHVMAGPDVRVNDTGDTGNQRETAVARRPPDASFPSGILCAAWNDTTPALGVHIGYGYSTNGGSSWADKGPLLTAPSEKATADPDVEFRLLDQSFYILSNTGLPHGLAVHRTATCNLASSFSHFDVYRGSPNGHKGNLTINNWAGPPGNPRNPLLFHDRMFVASNLIDGSHTMAIWRSDNGSTWLPSAIDPLVNPYPAGYDVKAGSTGPWLTTAPNGNLYVAWARFQQDASCSPNCWPNGPLDIQVSRSTDGGVTFAMESSPILGARNPVTPGTPCFDGLIGGPRLELGPQIEADDQGIVHLVYVAGDPNPVNSADYSNIYYTRGVPDSNGNLVWSTPLRLNQDSGSADQFMPSLMVAQDTNKLAVYWYDRRAATNPDLPQSQIYRRRSQDRGLTWGTETLTSDAIAPGVGTSCDALGDYNEGFADTSGLNMIWSDRRTQSGSNDTNVFFERIPE